MELNKEDKKEDKPQQATFAAGCFWHVEETFAKVPGVIKTEVGFSGGHLIDPSYEQVCRGDTGHAESLHLEYDPTKISYAALLDIFFQSHNPTTLNRQGPDIGSQYRSVIFYHNEEQKEAAELAKKTIGNAGQYKNPVVTEIVKAGPFFRAEEYHQRYFKKHGGGTCQL